MGDEKGEEMRVLTVRQPWAGAIVWRGKDVENRVRNIAGSYRGPVAIHVGQRHNYDAVPAHNEIADHIDENSVYGYGHIIGVVDLVDVHTAADCWERDKNRLIASYRADRRSLEGVPDNGAGGIIGKIRFCSAWAMDEHQHLVLANARPIDPVPYTGALGLRRLPAEVVDQINSRLPRKALR